jgi:L-ascorbate metabolism protein UlaG (beta-lactamase superfamily)
MVCYAPPRSIAAAKPLTCMASLTLTECNKVDHTNRTAIFRLAMICSAIPVLIITSGCHFLAPSMDPYAVLTLTAPPNTVNGLRAQWFGVSTILLRDEKTSIMIDGFFTRPGPATLLLGKLSSNEDRIKSALSKGGVGKIDALLVAHSHHDHAMDSAKVARLTNATIYGSRSTANLVAAEQLGIDRMQVVRPGQVQKVGDFEITFFESLHSPDPILKGYIKEQIYFPTRVWNYKMGENYSYLVRHPASNVLIVPSANVIIHQFKKVKADIVFLSIATLGKQSDDFIEQYWEQVVKATGAKIVIPIHWDNFTRSLDEPLLPLPYLVDNFERAMYKLQKLAGGGEPQVSIRFFPLYRPVTLPIKVQKLVQ